MKSLKIIAVFFLCFYQAISLFSQSALKSPERDTVLITMSSLSWNDSIWNMDYYEVYQYNDKDQVELVNRYSVSANGVSNTSRKVYEYYEEFDSLKYFAYYFKNIIPLQLGYSNYYFYDDSLRLIKRKFIHNFPGAGFIEIYNYIYDIYKLKTIYGGKYWIKSYYYDNDLCTGYIHLWSEDSVNWVNDDSAHYSYDSNGYVLKKEYLKWDDTIWQYHKTIHFSYSDDYLEMTRIEKEWQDTSLVNSTKEIHLFNDEGQISEIVFQEWQDSIWVNKTKENTSYYDSELLTEKIVTVWQDSNWVNNTKYQYYYGVLGEAEITTGESNIKIYPNPNEGRFFVEFNDNSKGYSVSIFDMSGVKVYNREKLTGKILSVDISELQAGIYILKLFSGDAVYSRKAIINH